MSFHQIAKRVVEDSTSTDPADLAKEFLNELDNEVTTRLKSDFLFHAAKTYMREVIRAGRSESMTEGLPQTTRADQTFSIAQHSGMAWKKILQQREYLPSSGQWIRLATATVEQVQEMATYRHQIAAQNRSRAETYEAIALLMQKRRVDRVEDLSPEDLTAIYEEGLNK